MREYHVKFPDYFDDYSGEISSKGVFSDVLVIVGDQCFRPMFYDVVRLVQDAEEEFRLGLSCFAEENVIIVPEITRTNLLAAIAQLATSDFSSLIPSPERP